MPFVADPQNNTESIDNRYDGGFVQDNVAKLCLGVY